MYKYIIRVFFYIVLIIYDGRTRDRRFGPHALIIVANNRYRWNGRATRVLGERKNIISTFRRRRTCVTDACIDEKKMWKSKRWKTCVRSDTD